ncbi:aquaporin [Vulcaniibacterium thermophilum]|jgi:glycerol uptake facilitator-like aquaporin|uniref:MIP family protein n=1 Tax=Vulcaniibacterium thermophilum TaxID=1169913 RepID=A0A919D9C9_9GAMM|nr:aquaporin [Vulcaniibacterium thermophilum]GHE25551.1 MIP family protein [Vulcaniibacterium thermophilum]
MTRTARALLAELLGTALLLAIVVGSGVMGVRLAQGNDAVALLANAAATAGGLYVLIVLLGPVSGAHFNPAVTLVMRLRGVALAAPWTGYVAAQVLGGLLGVTLAHAMFELPLWQPGVRARSGTAQMLSEGVATFGLLLAILLGARLRPAALPVLVAAWIFAAYWFTASTSFANPAVTLARSLTQSFAGIRPADVPAFVLAQLAGAVAAVPIARALLADARGDGAATPQ